MTNPASDPNQMLSTQDAAALLGLQPCTLAAWREDGSQPGLAFFKLGKAVRYRYADLLAFIETRKASSTLVARRNAASVAPTRTPKKMGSSKPPPSPVSREEPTPAVKTAPGRRQAKRGEDRQQSLF